MPVNEIPITDETLPLIYTLLKLIKERELVDEKINNIKKVAKYEKLGVVDESILKELHFIYQDMEESDKRILPIINRFKNFNVEYLSLITSNKCIIDPSGNPISDISKIKIDVSDVNDELLNTLKRNPNYFYKLPPRKFEEVVAEILARKGYDVKLTATSRDGGKDIYVAHDTDFGTFLYIVECKKYSQTNKVGVSVLRDLYGVITKENLNAGIIATTSYFSKPAKEFQQGLEAIIKLKDFDSIKQWLYEIAI